jgi:ribulose-bisphosphate carboxylase large chain
VPGETPALKARSGARVERLEVLDHADRPSLPVIRPSARYTRCLLDLSWPLANVGPSLPNLLATIAGNLFELRQVSGLRLLDLVVPPPLPPPARARPSASPARAGWPAWRRGR